MSIISEEHAERKLVYDYVKFNKDRLPEYWQDKGIAVCIEGICCMIARGKYTDEAIAEYYGCPTALVKQVKIAYKKTIDMMEKQRKEMTDTFGDECFVNDPKTVNDESCVRLLCNVFKRCKDED